LRIDHQARLGGRARRLVFTEVAHVDAVEGTKVARVLQPDGALAHVVERGAGQREHFLQVFHDLARLRLDAAHHDLAFGIVHGHLARHVDEVAGAHGRGEGAHLAVGGEGRGAEVFERHGDSL
jgi:uncharacterized protein YceH (UPF0502 family)